MVDIVVPSERTDDLLSQWNDMSTFPKRGFPTLYIGTCSSLRFTDEYTFDSQGSVNSEPFTVYPSFSNSCLISSLTFIDGKNDE